MPTIPSILKLRSNDEIDMLLRADLYNLVLFREPTGKMWEIFSISMSRKVQYMGKCKYFKVNNNEGFMLKWHKENGEKEQVASIFHNRNRTFAKDLVSYPVIKEKSFFGESDLKIKSLDGLDLNKERVEGKLKGVFVVDSKVYSLWGNDQGEFIGWRREKNSRVSLNRSLVGKSSLSDKVDQENLELIERVYRYGASKGIAL